MRIDSIHCCGWGDGSEESCALAKRFNTDLYTIISAMVAYNGKIKPF